MGKILKFPRKKAKVLKHFKKTDRATPSASLTKKVPHLSQYLKNGSRGRIGAGNAPKAQVSARNRMSGTPSSKLRKLAKKYPQHLTKGRSREGNVREPKLDTQQPILS